MGNNTIGEYFNGYILVKVESLSPEKVINLSARNGIILKDIKRENYTTIVFKMRHNEYKNLKRILKNSNTKTKILKKYGVRFTYGRLTRRKFFLIGSLVFIGIIIFLSNIIWNIDIRGNRKLDTLVINEALGKAGLKVGIFKYNINPRRVEEEIIRNLKEVSVIKINFDGTKASVEIVERTMPTKIVDRNTPANIVAVKEGIITNIYAYKGVPLVKKGDLVKKNQVLISGRLSDTENELNKPIHAMGLVKAKIWYEAVRNIDLKYKSEKRTGRFKQKVYYQVGSKRIYIKNNNINFKKYDKIEYKSKVHIFGISTPIDKVTEAYYEKVDELKVLSIKEATALGISEATTTVKDLIPIKGKIISVKNFTVNSKKSVKVRVLYIVEEDIGIEKELK